MMTENKGSRASGGEARGKGQTMPNICCNFHLSLMISGSVCVCVCVSYSNR